ncbi:hypothetical protein [Vibrio lentus]|uniref:hypothetical protein n=1 Tax=Vibrio lentus TaxID=136468 RepID=UPI0039A7210F
MATNDLDELFTDDFLDSLDDDSTVEQSVSASWVVDDKDHTTYKAYHAILELKAQAEKAIENFGEVETTKTPKFYQLKKSHVAKAVGVSAQVFLTHPLSALIFVLSLMILTMSFLSGIKPNRRNKSNGKIRDLEGKKKGGVVTHQSLEKKYNALKALTTKEVLNLSIEKMPIDLKAKLGL